MKSVVKLPQLESACGLCIKDGRLAAVIISWLPVGLVHARIDQQLVESTGCLSQLGSPKEGERRGLTGTGQETGQEIPSRRSV